MEREREKKRDIHTQTLWDANERIKFDLAACNNAAGDIRASTT